MKDIDVVEAEAAVLGAIAIDAVHGKDNCIDDLPLEAEDFSNPFNRQCFGVMKQVADAGQRPELLTLQTWPGANLDPVTLATLTDIIPTSANVAYYAGIVRTAADLRKLVRLSAEIREAVAMGKPVLEILDMTERRTLEIAEVKKKDIVPVRQLVSAVINDIEEAYHRQNAITGVPTGYPTLDDMLAGLQAGDMVVIGARPSVGKTALAVCMAANQAVDRQIPVGFFSSEMENKKLTRRALASIGRLSLTAINTGRLLPADFHKLTEAAAKLHDAPLYIEDTANIPFTELRSKARRMKRMGVQVIYVDYFGLIEYGDERQPRYEIMSYLSRQFKKLARELHLPLVLLSQVGRQAQKGRATLADLRETGALEQDADVVIFPHREPDQQHPGQEIADVTIAKQRNGPTGTVPFHWFPQYTRFEEAAQEGE